MSIIESIQDELSLLALASHAALLAEREGVFANEVERQQFVALANSVRPLLAKIDEENPSLIPVPHDGVAWAERLR